MEEELTPQENQLAQSIREAGENATSTAAVAAAIAAGFGLWTMLMRRYMMAEIAKDKTISRKSLYEANKRVFGSKKAVLVATITPAIISGMADGVLKSNIRTGNTEWLEQVANRYASRLADHLNDVSADALIRGYQAQVNRKITARAAAEHVIDAFGVAPRTMKSLVNIWSAPPPKDKDGKPVETRNLTDRPGKQAIKERIDALVAKGINNRAHALGDTEAYTASNQGKAIVWLHAQGEGVIPKNAHKVWITAQDERVCPTCGPMHRKSVRVNEQFVLPSGERVWSPSPHVNCRCEMRLQVGMRPVELDIEIEDLDQITIDEDVSAFGVVSKARWDETGVKRDQGGQFSRSESRTRQAAPQKKPQRTQFKEVDRTNPQVQQILSEATALHQSLGGKTAAQVMQDMGVSEQVQAPSRVQAPQRIQAPKQVQALNPVSAPQEVSAPTQERLQAPQQASTPVVRNPISAPARKKLNALNLNRKIEARGSWLDGLEKLHYRMPTVPEAAPTKSNSAWMPVPDGKVWYGLVAQEQFSAEYNRVDIPFEANFYEADRNGMMDDRLKEDIKAYWDDVYHEDLQDFFSDSGWGEWIGEDPERDQPYVVVHDQDEGITYEVPLDALDTAFSTLINPDSESRGPEWVSVIAVDSEGNEYEVDWQTEQLAHDSGLYDFVAEYTPTILSTQHFDINNFDGTSGGTMHNPGLFSVDDVDQTPSTAFRVLNATPEELTEQSDESFSDFARDYEDD